MVDVHCHLNFHAYAKDYDLVIKDAAKAGVTAIINTGTSLESSEKAIELSLKYDNLWAIVGIHPHHADKPESDWLEKLDLLAKHPNVVGVGECGMDFYNYRSNGIVDTRVQKIVFEKQIELAWKNKLPLQIHNRHAGEEILEILTYHRNSLNSVPGMFHCFAGEPDILKRVLELNFYVGFDGNITYKGLAPGENTALETLAKLAPLQRIVTETDSPFLTPIPYRGNRNRPEYVILVGQFLAKVKRKSFEEIEKQTTENAKMLFKLKKRSL